MKKSKQNTILHLYRIFFAAILILILMFCGIVFYLIKGNTGNSSVSWSSWPINITNKFSENIEFVNGKPKLTSSGEAEIKKYNLSLQIVDKNGDVYESYNCPSGTLKHYSPIDMVQVYKGGAESQKRTYFVGSAVNNVDKWTYIIGFPAKILKITMYMNYDSAAKLKFVLLIMLSAVLLLIAAYGIKMNSSLSKVIDNIGELASDSYVPIKRKGIYHDVYESLNILNERLKANEKERKRDEKSREEWVANISHDLKTPLSPIKGYAEILIDSGYDVSSEDINKYGTVILKSAKNMENLIENLNFTYQLKNNMIPMKKQNQNMVRLLKEVIIDILNDPKYEDRNITFSCSEDKINFNFDNTLLKRAFNNLIYNAVAHNDKETIINVSMHEDEYKDKIYITIEDNGKGISEEDLKKLFERYYRGTSSEVKTQGSGLGMAIAKQIIESHEGKISVESRVDAGTKINIEFPITGCR